MTTNPAPAPLTMADLVKALEPIIDVESALGRGSGYYEGVQKHVRLVNDFGTVIATLSPRDFHTLVRIASALPSYVLAPRGATDETKTCTCRWGKDADGSEFGPCEYCEEQAHIAEVALGELSDIKRDAERWRSVTSEKIAYSLAWYQAWKSWCTDSDTITNIDEERYIRSSLGKEAARWQYAWLPQAQAVWAELNGKPQPQTYEARAMLAAAEGSDHD